MNNRYVSRSAFQKKSEECKRLKADIREIVMNQNVRLLIEWRKHFEEDEAFTNLIREAALKHIGKTAKSKLQKQK